MATIVYALCGEGRGHTSRVLAVSQLLRQRGHRVVFCCGGAAKAFFEARGERVIEVPALHQVIRGNKGEVGTTVLQNCKPFLFGFDLPRLTEALWEERADLLINDFEPFSPLAAAMIGFPILSFNRQQVVTETRYSVPLRYRASAQLTAAAINYLAPSEAEHILLPSFAFPPPKHPRHVTLIPPVVRETLQGRLPRTGEHLLVYYNGGDQLSRLLPVLGAVKASFIVYGVTPPSQIYPNILFKPPSEAGFQEDLLECRGVICTAGFNLISEALYLGKPLLVNPNRGLFEQTLNAVLLERAGLGRASFGELPSRGDLEAFLGELPRLNRLQRPLGVGNQCAVELIESLLRGAPASAPHPRSHRSTEQNRAS